MGNGSNPGKPKLLPTKMSPVFYRVSSPGSKVASTELKQIEHLYWLDRMLNGGLKLPSDVVNRKAPSYMLLLQGSPGTGKTTFALELALNLAKQGMNALYISAESTAANIIENARSFGWTTQALVKHPRSCDLPQGQCVVYGTDCVPSGQLAPDFSAEEFLTGALKGWPDIVDHAVLKNSAGELDVVIIDSLNILQTRESQENIFGILYRQIATHKCRPLLLILMLDSPADAKQHNFWEFVCDAVFSFKGTIGDEGYFLRTFQISKIKNHPHAWGEHIFKIYPGGKVKEDGFPESHRRANKSPYLETGSTFIFPSIHWHLSQIQSTQEELSDSAYPTPLKTLNEILAGDPDFQGFPGGCLTALVGRRGGMKSHFAYYFCLAHCLGRIEGELPKNVLLVSLRDDIAATIQTLASVLSQESLVSANQGLASVLSLIESDRLEIVYNEPGYVTPAEFFHRIYVALNRPREAKKLTITTPDGEVHVASPPLPRAEIVVVDGLDHIEANFPLCANENMFVPALNYLFQSKGVCAVAVSAQYSDDRATHTAIRPLAHLLLEFDDPTDEETVRANIDMDAQRSKVTAVRVPAGQLGGRAGILHRSSNTKSLSFVALNSSVLAERPVPS